MSRALIHPTRRHPLTGAQLHAVGVLPNGKVIWPILGGDDTVPPIEAPEGVTAEEWDALGDPGKKAIVREREARQEAERKLAAAHARPTPPPGKPAVTTAPPAGDAPDVAKLVQEAVAAAIKPFTEANEARTAAEAQDAIKDKVRTAATGFHDADDAVAGIDLTKVVTDGAVDPTKLAAELEALGARKPHLVKDGRRFAPAGAGGGPGSGAKTTEDKTKESLARMAEATGLKLGS